MDGTSARRGFLQWTGAGLATTAVRALPAQATQAIRRAMPVTAGLLDVRGFGSEGDGRAINSTSIKAASLAAETSRGDTVVRLAGVIPATPSPTGAM